MSFDTPLVEYLIIGFQISMATLLIAMAVFGIPISAIINLDAGSALVLLPVIYLMGMLFDSITHYPLEPFRIKIRDSVFKYEKYKDEFIAISSPTLYSAYDSRVRRVRIVGAAIFNWPLLAVGIALHLDSTKPLQYIFVIVLALILSIVSILAWREFYRRAYKFRKNSCDVIREQLKRYGEGGLKG